MCLRMLTQVSQPFRFVLGGASYQIVISKATMMSSFRTSAVKEMETMFRNSFSNRTKDMIIIADPISNETPKVVVNLTQDRRAATDEPW